MKLVNNGYDGVDCGDCDIGGVVVRPLAFHL